MRVFKLILALIIFCLIGLFTYQNLDTWEQLIQFKLNLGFVLTEPGLKLYLVIVFSALIGFIAGLATMTKPYLKIRRLLRRERNEKRQAEEQTSTQQPSAESHDQALDPTNPAE